MYIVSVNARCGLIEFVEYVTGCIIIHSNNMVCGSNTVIIPNDTPNHTSRRLIVV